MKIVVKALEDIVGLFWSPPAACHCPDLPVALLVMHSRTMGFTVFMIGRWGMRHTAGWKYPPLEVDGWTDTQENTRKSFHTTDLITDVMYQHGSFQT